jgi:hypothetical protein
MVLRGLDVAHVPGAPSSRGEHDEKEKHDSPGAVAAPPPPTLNRNEHVERHRPRVASSAVGLQQLDS